MRRTKALLIPILALLVGTPTAFAGRPVFHTLTRNQLIEGSDFVFEGWPSHNPATPPCAHELGRWQIHKVLRGDRTLEGKVIGVAREHYALFAEYEGRMLPSYAANRYGTGSISMTQGTSFLFTNRRADGCFELAADGAQESRDNDAEIEALFAGPKECDVTLRGFERLADKMPRECATDADCKLFYTHPNSCGRPYIWNKSAEAKMDENFTTLQARARTACMDQWSKQPACSPVGVPIRCHEKRCGEGRPANAPKVKFTKGTVEASCAPHDASSVMISVTEAQGRYPIMTVNWWGEEKPNLSTGGTFKIRGKTPSMENGFQASYCLYEGGCKPLKTIEITFEWKKDGSGGTLNFSFTAEDGEIVSGQVPITHPKPTQRVLCG